MPQFLFILCFVKVTMALQGKEGTVSPGVEHGNSDTKSQPVQLSWKGIGVLFFSLFASM